MAGIFHIFWDIAAWVSGSILFFYRRYSLILTKNTYIHSKYVSRDTEIGDNTYVWTNTAITRAVVGNYCSIASNVSIGMGEHNLDKISTNSIFYENQYDELTKKECIIWNDVWIGVDAIIRRWVTIGNGAVIGANSFVNKDIPAYAIVAWSPAKIIRYRFTWEQIALIESSAWWNLWKDDAKKVFLGLEKDIFKASDVTRTESFS